MSVLRVSKEVNKDLIKPNCFDARKLQSVLIQYDILDQCVFRIRNIQNLSEWYLRIIGYETNEKLQWFLFSLG